MQDSAWILQAVVFKTRMNLNLGNVWTYPRFLKSFVSVPYPFFLFMLFIVSFAPLYICTEFSADSAWIWQCPLTEPAPLLWRCCRPHPKFALTRLYGKRKGGTNTKCGRKQACCETQSLRLALEGLLLIAPRNSSVLVCVHRVHL